MGNNMYDWVSKCRPNFIGGQCPHNCVYCHTKDSPWPNVVKKYSGKIRLFEDEFKKPLKSDSGKPIFVGSCFDMWAEEIPAEWIERVLHHCNNFPNKYVFQTKNPHRFTDFKTFFADDDLLGLTIESNRDYGISKAPPMKDRATSMKTLSHRFKTFVTVEPILDFDIVSLKNLVRWCWPKWVNIGADSKRHNLPEPSWDKVQALIAELSKFTEVKCKSNLDRLRRQ